MSGRKIEENGEYYLVSDDVETLDTENLVEKDVITRTFNTVKSNMDKLNEEKNKKSIKCNVVYYVESKNVFIDNIMLHSAISDKENNSIEYKFLIEKDNITGIIGLIEQDKDVLFKSIEYIHEKTYKKQKNRLVKKLSIEENDESTFYCFMLV